MPAAATRADHVVSKDDIRVRAYFLSLERNGGPADPLLDWLHAEQELTARAIGTRQS